MTKRIGIGFAIGICCILFCTGALFAEEYQVSSDFFALMDQTYESISQSVVFRDTLSMDLFLFDEYCLALSALTQGAAIQLSFDEIKSYYQESLDRYNPADNFLLMIMVNDPQAAVNPALFASQVGICNSREEVIFGTELERYTDSIYIIRYPRSQIEKLLQNEEQITVLFKGATDHDQRVAFQRNYAASIPESIRELVRQLNL